MTLWDFIEGTWHDYGDHTILHVNTTQVDAFGLAFELMHSGNDPSSPDKPMKITNGFIRDDARPQILESLSQTSSPWPALFVNDPNGRTVRVLAPIKALDQHKFPEDWLDKSILSIASQYSVPNGSRMLFTHENIRYLGSADQKAFIFSNDEGDGKKYRIPLPTTRQCLENNIKVEPNDHTGKALATAFCASILRGTLWKSNLVPVPQEQRSEYYTTDPNPFEYAKIIHQYGMDNHAFCFGYDEVAGDAGTNRDVRDPDEMILWIHDARGLGRSD